MINSCLEIVFEYGLNENDRDIKGVRLLDNFIKVGIKNLTVNGDSQLVIKQMNNVYKVNSENLIEMHKIAKHLQQSFESISYNHVYRKDNKRADALSNDGLLKLDGNIG